MDKWLLKSKTFLVVLLGIALEFLTSNEVITIIPAKYAHYIGATTLLLTLVLRAARSQYQGGLTLMPPAAVDRSRFNTGG